MGTHTAPLVLASSSRYRRELLERFQLAFTHCSPDIDETALDGESPRAQAVRLARTKAQAVAIARPGSVVIGSDQVAWCADTRYGKPGHRGAAIAQLTALSGKVAVFDTALCVLDTRSGAMDETCIPTEVEFRRLSMAEIERYVDAEQAFDCAGAAKSEALGITLLERISGNDPTALIGLPLIALAHMLRRAGYPLP